MERYWQSSPHKAFDKFHRQSSTYGLWNGYSSVFLDDRTLLREVAGIPKARGRQDVARGMFVDTSRDRQQLTVFIFKCESRFHWITAGEKGGGWGT